uniref:C2 domain-containing protein n=1 Tax=Panagrolaimus sp. PS1159 TaxID=55785 RepID=A0AC35FS78_9BILA
MQIVGSQEKNDFGDLLLYLAYSAKTEKLFITVAKAYNLRPMDITGASDPYVRCEQIYQRKRIKLRKTSIKRANLNPVYHECLEFDLALNQIDETNILIQVMDWDRIGRDDLLGCCVLGKESPTKEGRQQWEQVFSTIRSSTTANKEQLQQQQSLLPNGSVIINEIDVTGNVEENEVPKAVGQWHSILGEVPEGFRNIPKANKKHQKRSTSIPEGFRNIPKANKKHQKRSTSSHCTLHNNLKSHNST